MIFADAAVVEQQSQPVAVEVAVAAGDALGVLDLQVEVLGRAVRHCGVVEVQPRREGQLMLPAKDMPSVADLRLFMDSQGFDEAPPGFAGSLWTHDRLEVTLALPKANDPMALYPLVSELAELSRVRAADMAQTIKYCSYDMADFRAAGNLLDEFDSIPLLAAETIISNVCREHYRRLPKGIRPGSGPSET